MTMASSSGGGGVPPGFRFHPTDEELLHYYLKKKVTFQKFEMEVIREVDLNKMEPWDLQERCRIGSTPQNEWYFFSHKDRKYPTGSRTNRATNAGFWKATGRDKCIRNSFKKIGMRKTLVFYRGRAPHGQKTDWIMHEYRLEDAGDTQSTNSNEDGWVVCRVFKKKNLFKAAGGEGTASVGMAANQLNNTPNANQSRTFAHRDGQYLVRQQPAAANPHNVHLYKSSELALNYSPIPMPYAHINQPQNLLPVLHKPMPAYDYSSTTQLISSPRDCESGSVNHLRYEAGLEVGTCEPSHQTMVAAAAAEGRDHHDENMNEWGMLDRFVSSNIGDNEDSSKGAVRFQDEDGNPPSIHQMDQLSLRGEMDFWGYGK